MSARIWRFRRSCSAAVLIGADYSSVLPSIVGTLSSSVNAVMGNCAAVLGLCRYGGLFGVVDLGALELVGVVDVEGFPLGEEVDRGDGCFAVAVAGFLCAAEGQMGFGTDGGRVDVDDAGVEIADGLERTIHVMGVDGGGE